MSDSNRPSNPSGSASCVIVQRHVRPSRPAGEPLPAMCMVLRQVRLLERYASLDGSQELYVFEAPDAQLVRELAQRAWPDDEVAVWRVRPAG